MTTWVIPLVSHSIVEYLAGLVVIATTLILDGKENHFSRRHVLWTIALIIAVVTWPVLFPQYNLWGLLMIFYAV